MRLKVELDKQDTNKISLNSLLAFMNKFNRKDMEAYFKRRGDFLEVIISKKENA